MRFISLREGFDRNLYVIVVCNNKVASLSMKSYFFFFLLTFSIKGSDLQGKFLILGALMENVRLFPARAV